MDGPALSRREKRILEEIERELRSDAALDRGLRTMRPGPVLRAGRLLRKVGRVPTSLLVPLVALSVSLLLVAGSQTHSARALASFSVVWVPTLLLLAARLATRRGRRSGRHSRVRQ